MKDFTKEIASPRYSRWMAEPVLRIGGQAYSRHMLDEMGVGLHTIAAKRLNRILSHHRMSMPRILEAGLKGFLNLPGLGETSAIVISHVIVEQGYDVFEWIGEKGRSIRGAVATAKGKHTGRIPGRARRKNG